VEKKNEDLWETFRADMEGCGMIAAVLFIVGLLLWLLLFRVLPIIAHFVG